MKRYTLSVLTLLIIFTNILNAQFIQQGEKLIGSGAAGIARQGTSVSISADGNTAIVGGSYDDNHQGAAWVFTRQNGVWTQQGEKLIGSDAVGEPLQGYSVAISSDGNTAIVGGFEDNNNQGAAWVFTRQNGVWTQQGDKLVGTGAAGIARQGSSVSISADGNTAIVGGFEDNDNQGAAWVFTRQNGVWTQQGDKLVGTGAVEQASQGWSVSMSSDGNTAIVGGFHDNGAYGAAWVFTRQNGVWTQQGDKLVGSGAVGNAFQGSSVSLSSDGNTAIVGGFNDDNRHGAVWVFTRQNEVWTQQGDKLVGSGNVGQAWQGNSVSLSSDGNTAIVGGLYDNPQGAAWIFTRQNGAWTQLGSKLVGSGAVGYPYLGWSVSMSSDGNTAIVGGYENNGGEGAAWVFERQAAYSITASAGVNGTITPEGTVSVNRGENITFAITPNTGYGVADVIADGISQGGITSFTFNNVTQDHSISAIFTPLINITGNVSLSGSGLATVKLFLGDKDNLPYRNITEPAVTDASGNYTFSNVPAAEGLKIYMMEPFGYQADQNPKPVIISQQGSSPAASLVGGFDGDESAGSLLSVNPNDTYTVNFTLAKTLSKNQAMASAYWGSQFKYYVMQTGTPAAETEANLLKYIGLVQKHYTPYFNIFQDKQTITDWYNLFYTNTAPLISGSARSEIAALVLNIVSLRLPQYLPVTLDSRSAGEALTKLSQMFIAANGNNSAYFTVFQHAYKINTKQKLAKNIIPQSNILYKSGNGIEQTSSDMPVSFKLYGNYPNPFNPSTTIQFDIAEITEVNIVIYDIQGRVVDTIYQDMVQPGSYRIQWNASKHPSGMYMCRLTAGNFRDMKKLLLLK